MIDEYVKEYNVLTAHQGRNAAGADTFKIEKILLDECGYRPDMRVLDYGCGWGSLLTVIGDYKSYLGVDISPLMIDLAKTEFPGERFEVNEIGKLQTEPNDLIIAHSVFTHIPKNIVNEALSDVSRNLRGFAVIDIFYGNKGFFPYEQYTHYEWMRILKNNNLQGKFVKSRERSDYQTHQYYKIWQSP